jgi:hypothetical protein
MANRGGADAQGVHSLAVAGASRDDLGIPAPDPGPDPDPSSSGGLRCSWPLYACRPRSCGRPRKCGPMAAPEPDTEIEQPVPRGGGQPPDDALALRASDCRAGLPAADGAGATSPTTSAATRLPATTPGRATSPMPGSTAGGRHSESGFGARRTGRAEGDPHREEGRAVLRPFTELGPLKDAPAVERLRRPS